MEMLESSNAIAVIIIIGLLLLLLFLTLFWRNGSFKQIKMGVLIKRERQW